MKPELSEAFSLSHLPVTEKGMIARGAATHFLYSKDDVSVEVSAKTANAFH
jgi:hypothetical protein